MPLWLVTRPAERRAAGEPERILAAKAQGVRDEYERIYRHHRAVLEDREQLGSRADPLAVLQPTCELIEAAG